MPRKIQFDLHANFYQNENDQIPAVIIGRFI
jgi:hypothetical protein